MVSDAKMGISLVANGTLNPRARETYEKIKSSYVQAFPGADIRLAFTSDFIRRELSEKHGIFFHNPFTALAELQDQGHKNVIVQPLQVVPGSEFHMVASLVQGLKNVQGKMGFRNLRMGMPLLASLEDCMKVSEALRPEFRTTKVEEQNHENACSTDPEEMAFVLMGHGTGHPADSVYSQMAGVLEKDHRNVFLGTLEGFPGINEVFIQAKRSMIKKIRLMPFLLVAGGHALEDLAGNAPSSWKNAFEREGFQTEVKLKGLVENEGVISILVEHTTKASEGFQL